MKNKKFIIAFMLVIALLLVMVTTTKASGIPGLDNINNGEGTNANLPNNNDLPTNNNDVPANNNLTNANTNINTNTNTNTLPKTGVESDATLFIFIGVCVASAVYAYFKIRKYNNIH